jgi:hypothetical protein
MNLMKLMIKKQRWLQRCFDDDSDYYLNPSKPRKYPTVNPAAVQARINPANQITSWSLTNSKPERMIR